MHNILSHKDIDKLIACNSLIEYQSIPWFSTLVYDRAEPIYFICPVNSNVHIPVAHKVTPVLSAFMPSDSLKPKEIELPTHFPKDNLVVYTDASFTSNTDLHFGGLGAVFVINDATYDYHAGLISTQFISSSDLECLAAGLAISKAISLGYKSVDIHYDCNAINHLQSECLNTTPVADFCRSILKVAEYTNTKISFHHVKAHAGDGHNTLADYLAGASQNAARMFAKRQNFNVVEASTIKKAINTLISAKIDDPQPSKLEEANSGNSQISKVISKPEPKPKTKAKPKSKPKAKPKTKAKTKTKPKTEAKPKAKPKTKAETKPKPKIKLKPNDNNLETKECICPRTVAVAKVLNVNPKKLDVNLGKTSFKKLYGIGPASNNKIKGLLKDGDIKIKEDQIDNITKSLYGDENVPDNLNNKLGIMILAIIHTMDLDMNKSLNNINQYDLTDISI